MEHWLKIRNQGVKRVPVLGWMKTGQSWEDIVGKGILGQGDKLGKT